MLRSRNKGTSLICLFAVLLMCSLAQAERLRVGVLCSAPEKDSPFWSSALDVMRAVADDLDIELVVKCSRRGSLALRRASDVLLQSDPPLNYLIATYHNSNSFTRNLLVKTRSDAIKVFTFGSVGLADRMEMGGPRDKLENWIGHIVPDEEQAASELTEHLIALASKANGESEVVNITALTNNQSSIHAREREKGLRAQAEGLQNVNLEVVMRKNLSPGNWSGRWSVEEIESILRERPETNVVWALTEAIALAGMSSAERLGKKPGKDIFVGGFDLNPEVLRAIENKQISASMFGNFLVGAWALILVHDYHYGFEFKDDVGVHISAPYTVLTSSNITQYKVILDSNFWDTVDFKKLSKKHNSALKSYNFNINQFVD